MNQEAYYRALAFGQTIYRELDDHPARVASYATTAEEEVVALLHDTIEDGHATYSDIDNLNLGEDIEVALVLLTRDKIAQSYVRYIDEIADSGSDLAITVKIYDLMDHMHPFRVANISLSHLLRYQHAYAQLTEVAHNRGKANRNANV